MIVAERKQKTIMDKFEKFGEAMSDGRLTAPSDGKVYRLREAILLSTFVSRRDEKIRSVKQSGM